MTPKPGELGTGKLVPSEVGMGARNLMKAIAQRTRRKTREEKLVREGEREIRVVCSAGSVETGTGWSKDACVMRMSLRGGSVTLRSRWEIKVGTVLGRR